MSVEGKMKTKGTKWVLGFLGFIFGELESLMHQLSCAFPAATFDVWKAK